MEKLSLLQRCVDTSENIFSQDSNKSDIKNKFCHKKKNECYFFKIDKFLILNDYIPVTKIYFLPISSLSVIVMICEFQLNLKEIREMS